MNNDGRLVGPVLDDSNWPLSVDPVIKKHLSWVSIALHSTLVGVEAVGLFVAFFAPGGRVLYVGPFVGMCGIYQVWTIIQQIGKDHNADSYQIIKHHIPR